MSGGAMSDKEDRGDHKRVQGLDHLVRLITELLVRIEELARGQGVFDERIDRLETIAADLRDILKERKGVLDRVDDIEDRLAQGKSRMEQIEDIIRNLEEARVEANKLKRDEKIAVIKSKWGFWGIVIAALLGLLGTLFDLIYPLLKRAP